MPKLTIDQVNLDDASVLMRVDFNVPLKDGAIADDRRIRAAVPTIKSALDRRASVVLMSHLGRPEGEGYEEALSLRPVAARLGELLGVEVKFPSNDCVDQAAQEAVSALQPGEVLLLENLRFHSGEKAGDAGFAAKLAAYGTVYVNDAFGTAHRRDASMVAVPNAMNGPKAAGLLLAKELSFLSDHLESPEKPYVVVLGGAKVADKIPVIEHLMPKAQEVLIGGAMSYTFLAALGRHVGASQVEKERLADAKRMIDLAGRLDADLVLPQDHVCSDRFAATGGKVEVFDDAIDEGFMGLDIGPKTQMDFMMRIKKAKTIVWNGPMGVFEWTPYAVGTRSIASAVAGATAENGAISVVGGGDSAAAAERFGVADKVSHVSTGGGASLELLAGGEFDSVKLLDNA